MGSSLQAIVGACEPRSQPAMVLAGGYFGGWLPWESCAGLRADPQQLRAAGAGLGAGVLVVAPAGSCVVAETARIAAYLARESAGQCGPCVNGVAAVARDLARMCTRDAGRAVTERLRSRIDVIDGRGACALPTASAAWWRASSRASRITWRCMSATAAAAMRSGCRCHCLRRRWSRPTGDEAPSRRVDPIACDGHGLCADLLPERIELDEWGYPIVDRTPVRGDGPRTRGGRWRPARSWRCGWSDSDDPARRLDLDADATEATSPGVEGNRRLTATLGAVLLVLLAIEGGTIPFLGQLEVVHVVVGPGADPDRVVKLGTTFYRFARYYTREPGLPAGGAAASVMRVAGPLVVVTTVALFASGVVLAIAGRHSQTVYARPQGQLHRLVRRDVGARHWPRVVDPVGGCAGLVGGATDAGLARAATGGGRCHAGRTGRGSSRLSAASSMGPRLTHPRCPR